MKVSTAGLLVSAAVAIVVTTPGICSAQTRSDAGPPPGFGPNVRAYLQYLKDEEEVVDDRNSRPEIRRDYYLRNMNRIRALRSVALKIARASNNDYLPELEAVTADELHTLFEDPPPLANAKVGEVFNNTFRYLGKVISGASFFIFARLDPYEQAELIERERRAKTTEGVTGSGQHAPPTAPQTEPKADKSP